ncbi:uncharacterized protein [Palaemon carinicauda]|uniref:uncharacterized protein n=1 Tax=Palaemon carinicauda TaxID=392227 RepID=UPI0035B5F22F
MVVLQPIKPGPPRVSLSLKRGRGARRALSLLGNNDSRQNLHLAESLLTISAEEFAQKWNFDPIQGVPLSSGRFNWKPVNTPLASLDPPTAATSSSQSEVATSKTTWDVDLGSASDLPHPADDNSKVQMTCTTLPSSSSNALGQEVTQGQLTGASTGSINPPTKSAEVGTVKCVTEGHLSSSKTSACPEDTEKSQLMEGTPREVIKTEGDSGIESDESVADEQDSSSLPANDSSQINSLRQTHITEFVRPRKLASFKIAEPHPLTSSSSSSNISSCSKKRPASSLQDHQLNQPPHKKVLLHLRA